MVDDSWGQFGGNGHLASVGRAVGAARPAGLPRPYAMLRANSTAGAICSIVCNVGGIG
jgi:hypothetical protein